MITNHTRLTFAEIRRSLVSRGIDVTDFDAKVALVPTSRLDELVAMCVEMLERDHPAVLRAVCAGRN